MTWPKLVFIAKELGLQTTACGLNPAHRFFLFFFCIARELHKVFIFFNGRRKKNQKTLSGHGKIIQYSRFRVCK